MPCSASNNSINIAIPPGPDLPGFGLPVSPLSFTVPGFELPTEFIEDILDLIRQLGALFPSGLFKANLDGGMKDVMDVISDILSQLAPFLSFYNFIMAALNLFVCIIEVLCAIPDPIAVAFKLKRLFAECLPPFLNLFPWLALIAMILALLLLILALIQYIIQTILAILEELIQNLLLFGDVQSWEDGEAALAIATKIASLLCIIENILAILIAIAAIMAVIQALMQFAGIAICDEGDATGCCPPEICPPFIKNNKEIEVTNGTLVYYPKIGPDLSSLGLPPALGDLLGEGIELRKERWQLFDNDPDPEEPISLIITPPPFPQFFGSRIFYPEVEFNSDTPPQSSPYTVDMTLTVDPATFGFADTGGERTFKIKDCIVVRKPYVGIIPHDNSISIGTTVIASNNGTTGTFNLEGGLVYEEDDTAYQIGPVLQSGSDGVLQTVGTTVPIVEARFLSSSTTFGVADVGQTLKILSPSANEGEFTIDAVFDGEIKIKNNDGFTAESGISFQIIEKKQATLNTFIHQDNKVLESLPASDDGLTFDNVEFIWKPNHPALAGYNLITVGCMPEVSIEKAVQNAVITAEGIEPVIDRLNDAPDGELVPSTGALPNILGTQECVQNALNKLRTNINATTVAEFQATAITCLTDLQNQTLATYCDALFKAISVFKSSFEIDNDIQFTTRTITVSITLRDAGGTVISTNIPEECLDELFNRLKVQATLGNIGEFSYDAVEGIITAPLSSKIAGEGEITVSFDGENFQELIPNVAFDTPSEIIESVTSYQFIDAVDQKAPERDVTDTSQSGSE